MQTSFHAYTKARELESLSNDDSLVSVFASSDIKVYPFQIAAANFALKSSYQKGVILCDESGMGKSHEAMLVVSQKWLEGQNKILLAVPNADLLKQWAQLIDKHYTVPYITLTNGLEWNANRSMQEPNAFIQNAIIVTTYDFLAEHQTEAKAAKWDLTVWEEANALSSVYLEGNKQAKILKEIAADSYKILLTGTPIEKNIMDLYGLMYFIDESILPDEQTFLQRYLRKPENYPELAESVSKYCFRTLRKQAKQYALVPERVHITLEYLPPKKEQEVYNLLYAYIKKENKLAFPEMNQYDLSLRLLGLLGSSTAAIISTLDGIVSRLSEARNSCEEIAELENIKAVAQSGGMDEKAKQLLKAIPKIFTTLKKAGANQKAVIFTESVETQKYLYNLLKDKYKTTLYNGTADYSAIQSFKDSGEILLSTDNGARGFNLEESSFIVNYDLLYNTLKMEQRIDRCHRLNQQNDVITLAFIDKANFAEVRKLELVNKRTLVSDGVFGISDAVVGGFTDNLDMALSNLFERIRTKEQVASDYSKTLEQNKEEIKRLVESAEETLFTTFTKQVSDKVKIAPKYIEEKAKEMNAKLWELVKFFFKRYNQNNTDCVYVIDDYSQTITATNYTQLPCLFYYWSGTGNRRYISQKQYGMASGFKPHYGRITLTSVVGQGILHETDCTDSGELILSGKTEPCKIGLYSINIKPINKKRYLFFGKTQSGEIMSEEQCKAVMRLPVESFTESGRRTPAWLRMDAKYDELDRYVNVEELLKAESQNLSQAQAEEVERLKLKAKSQKFALAHSLDDLTLEIKAVEKETLSGVNDRMKTLSLGRKLSALQTEFKKKQESQFFEEMQIDVESEKQIDDFLGNNKLSAIAVRQYILAIKGDPIIE